jgi:DNA-binding NarL/FixJ family response regulator
MTKPIRIMIVDDQTLVREGLRKLLEMEADFDVVQTAHDGEAAIALVERLDAQQQLPDVILMDIRMPHLDGIAATRHIKARWPGVHIVILTTFDDVELIHAGLQAGALGYLLKDATSELLATTIRTAAQGQMLLQPDIASKIFTALPRSSATHFSPAQETARSPNAPSDKTIDMLTEREREILIRLARGIPNRQIAEELFLAEGTVKNHVSNILSKLGVRDRTQAALKAKELGLA